MKKAKFIVLARATPGLEQDLVAWLSDQHLPDMVRVPGIESATLFQLSSLSDAGSDFRTLAIYDVEADDPGAVVREAGSRMGTPSMPRNAALGGPNLAFLTEQLCHIRSETES